MFGKGRDGAGKASFACFTIIEIVGDAPALKETVDAASAPSPSAPTRRSICVGRIGDAPIGSEACCSPSPVARSARRFCVSGVSRGGVGDDEGAGSPESALGAEDAGGADAAGVADGVEGAEDAEGAGGVANPRKLGSSTENAIWVSVWVAGSRTRKVCVGVFVVVAIVAAACASASEAISAASSSLIAWEKRSRGDESGMSKR